MSAKQPEFRAAFFTRHYDQSVSFYRDGLELPVLESWDRGEGDRGIMFAAASGVIEVLGPPTPESAVAPWDQRSPQGVMFVIEVPNVTEAYHRARGKGLPVTTDLTDHPWGHRSFCVTDPDGLTLYLFEAIQHAEE